MKNMVTFVQKLMDSYKDITVNTYLWDGWVNLKNDLVKKGFDCVSIKGNRKQGSLNQTYVYKKDDCPYVFMFIFTSSEKRVFPLIIDKDVYEEKIGEKPISILKHHRRPVIGDGHRITKLHKYVMGMVGDDSQEIDHITHSSNICVKKFMRLCNHRKNLYNNAIYMSITDDDEFTGLFEATTQEQKHYLEELNYRGFYVEPDEERENLFRITSDEYLSEDKLIKDVQEIEKKLQGEYRYNPLYDCTHAISQLLMFRYLIGLLTEKEFLEGQKYFMQQTKSDFFLKYYGIDK